MKDTDNHQHHTLTIPSHLQMPHIILEIPVHLQLLFSLVISLLTFLIRTIPRLVRSLSSTILGNGSLLPSIISRSRSPSNEILDIIYSLIRIILNLPENTMIIPIWSLSIISRIS